MLPDRLYPAALCAGRPEKEHLWFKDGPPLLYLPLPIPDPERPWGNPCTTCTGPCVGHYLSPEKNWEVVKANRSEKEKPVQPPRQILGDFCKKSSGFSKEDVYHFARKCLLSKEDVVMWLTNIQAMKSHSKKKEKKRAYRKNKWMKVCDMHVILIYKYVQVHLELILLCFYTIC